LAKELAKPMRKALGPRPLTQEQSNSDLEKRADELENFKASEGWFTNREAKEAVQLLMRYSSNPKVLQLCDLVDDLLADELTKRLKQRSIVDYFNV
jgi:hypothetical protein